MKASDIMTSPAYTIRDGSTVGEAARIMAEKGIGTLPVVDDDSKIVGILSHTDFFLSPVRYPGAGGHLFDLLGSYVSPDTIEEVSKSVGDRPVKEVMKTPVITIEGDEEVTEVAKKMLGASLNRMPVVHDGRVIGIVARHDFVKLIAHQA
jgi:CBS domain-containing protein